MKAVLISIQPKWCEFIASGKKTVEIRKTKPKIPTPFKCYIYMTAGDAVYPVTINGAPYTCSNVGGKVVIGEFVCDTIHEFNKSFFDEQEPRDTEEISFWLDQFNLSYNELRSYVGTKDFYGWHISDLVFYDKPKRLSEFYQKCKSYDKDEWENDDCLECENPCGNGGKLYLKRPPQSWCYVEERGE